jgi:hypothetical protein
VLVSGGGPPVAYFASGAVAVGSVGVLPFGFFKRRRGVGKWKEECHRTS